MRETDGGLLPPSPRREAGGGGADTSALAGLAEAIAKAEAEIDRHVYALYQPAPKLRLATALIPEEIQLVEENRK